MRNLKSFKDKTKKKLKQDNDESFDKTKAITLNNKFTAVFNRNVFFLKMNSKNLQWQKY